MGFLKNYLFSPSCYLSIFYALDRTSPPAPPLKGRVAGKIPESLLLSPPSLREAPLRSTLQGCKGSGKGAGGIGPLQGSNLDYLG